MTALELKPESDEIDPATHKYKKSTIINANSDKPLADKSRHYVDGEAFYAAMVERHNEVKAAEARGEPKPKISEFIGECIIAIATNLSRKHQFANYPFRDEMVADAITHCMRYIDSFDINKSTNPFSYYTQAVYFQFLARIREERKHLYIKCKASMHALSTSSLSTLDETSSDEAKIIHDNLDLDTEFMESFVDDFEGKLKKTHTKRQLRGLEAMYVIPDEVGADE